MNDQNATTANTSEPKLCKMNCGFFGSNATGDLCSKCFHATRQKQGASLTTLAQPATVDALTPPPNVECEPITEVTVTGTPAPTDPSKKKKKKKSSYKSMIAGMMEASGPRDLEKEKESIARVTGGGQFSKIEKI